jgi:hypothetical protein
MKLGMSDYNPMFRAFIALSTEDAQSQAEEADDSLPFAEKSGE